MYKFLIFTIMMLPSVVFAGEARSVNFAAFQSSSPDTKFPNSIPGKLNALFSTLEDANVISLVSTADAMHGDVITVQTSVLRDESGNLSDFGIDCHLTLKNAVITKESSYLVGGMCKIIQIGRGENLKINHIIPHTRVPDANKNENSWILLYNNQKTGIAFYANVSSL